MFDIYTDSASNLTADLADTPGIKIIPYTCRLDGGEFVCYDENRPFEDTAREFYAKMREGAAVSTTLINAGRLAEAFEQSLRDGRDVLFIGMSSLIILPRRPPQRLPTNTGHARYVRLSVPRRAAVLQAAIKIKRRA